ncbi:methyltransferase [Salinivibrio sp. ES.052]|uniref:methyltransferase n=1 Tax=Salinivibrio sp. ES.052 TaxID=1882823 RepID=UPI00092BD497|nr:methyltransferase [Salinivibrio sp. ES.052]SIN99658.1 16S rRNA m(2)G 1207 methyltransferase /23S rRNA m(2)G-1835 methyltransferase [Salinivibrio sp. ES.052]
MKTELPILGRESALTVHRYPRRNNETLQAFDAADEYLIEHASAWVLRANARILIINDQFGALSCWASQQGFDVIQASDSIIAQRATIDNITQNQLPSITQLTSMDPFPSGIDAVIMRVPKNNKMLTWQLQQLASITDENTLVLAGAKAKEIHTSTLNQFEHWLGTTTTSLAKKKARLIFSTPNGQPLKTNDPMSYVDVPDFSMRLANWPNVFSAKKLDIAAYLMLPHIPSHSSLKRIVDLGCGNGVLAVQAARNNPEAFIHAIDESHMAIASANRNLKTHGIDPDRFLCEASDCLTDFKHQDVDLVLCNPPFHQQQAITDHIAWQMFCDAKRVLTTNGALLVIGNRHLGYHTKLKRLFGNASVVASNKKFVILKAVNA